jgi:hypothetical protein
MKSDTKILPNNIIYKLNNLRLYLFSSGDVFVINAWPYPKARKWDRKQSRWVNFRPKIKIPDYNIENTIRKLETSSDGCGQLLLPFCLPLADQEKLIWHKWYKAIPSQERGLVSLFPKRQFEMLCFLAYCGTAAYDLTKSNPALAFMLANNWIYHRPAVKQPIHSARMLLKPGKKQTDILAWLRFPKSEAVRKILLKIIPGAITIPALFKIRRAVHDEDILIKMSHINRFNAGVISIIINPKLHSYTTPSLLNEVSFCHDEEKWPMSVYTLSAIGAMYRILRPNGKGIRPFYSLSQLFDFHDSLLEDLRTYKNFKKTSFPDPPISGTEIIVPITKALDLIEESRIQHNCVADYFDEIAFKKKTYIYKVKIENERCTLAIHKLNDNWIISELKRACNEEPSENALKIVKDWLTAATAC